MTTCYDVVESLDCTRTVRRNADDLAAGARELGAVMVGRSWYYRPDETGEVIRLRRADVESAGASARCARGEWYSLWCASCGIAIKHPRRDVIDALS